MPEQTQKTIVKSATLMSVATFISRILGYIKDMIVAGLFGASAIADAFFVAFRIPNLFRELFAEGSMSSAFIPVLTEYKTKHSMQEAQSLTASVAVVVFVIVGAICLLGIVFAPMIVTAIAPGFVNNPEKFQMAVLMTRIMFPFLLCSSIASVMMGALNTVGIFFIPALAPALLNVITILSITTLSWHLTEPILSLAIGITAGGMVQVLWQAPAFFKAGFRLFRSVKASFKHPAVKRIAKLILPSTAAMAVSQINIFISTILASFLIEGSITYLYYSMRLIQFPIGIFGVAMGMAVLPLLSRHASVGDLKSVGEDFNFALRLLFFITLPAMAGLIALRVPIVNVLFQRGKFDYTALIGTADALLFYSLGIWAIVAVRITTSAFYSLQNTKTPVKVAMIAMLSNVVLSILLIEPLKHSGLALANSISACLNFAILFVLLCSKITNIDKLGIFWSFFKTILASVVMASVGYFMLTGEMWVKSGDDLIKAVYLCLTMSLCVGVYVIVMWLLRSEELAFLGKLLMSKFKRS